MHEVTHVFAHAVSHVVHRPEDWKWVLGIFLGVVAFLLVLRIGNRGYARSKKIRH